MVTAPSPRGLADPPAPTRSAPRALSVVRHSAQLFFSFFKTLVGKEVVVELKNGARSR